MTISPPAKIQNQELKPFQLLASGIDTLDLAINVTWQSESFFEYLTTMKDLAISEGKQAAVIIRDKNDTELWNCTIKPHGAKGHEWILSGNEYNLTIGNWLEPKSRPSIIAKIHSEALWRIGVIEAVHFLRHILEQSGAEITSLKASRVDLCIDITFPDHLWSTDLLKFQVTRASYNAPHFYNKSLTGISIGRSKVAARLYDKPLEIQQKSKKYWMYEVWGIEKVPRNLKIIRIEFQLRREALKDLGLDSATSVIEHSDNLWAYCTQKWLTFKDNPEEQHKYRNTLHWWKTVQNCFQGVQNPTPLIRNKSVAVKQKQLFDNLYGFLSSFAAIYLEIREKAMDTEITIEKTLTKLLKHAQKKGKNDFKFNIEVRDKRSKWHKAENRTFETYNQRQNSGFPDNSPIRELIEKRMEKEQWQNTSLLKN